MEPYYNMRFIQGWGENEALNHRPPQSPYIGMTRQMDIVRPSQCLCKNLIINYLPQTFTDKNLFDLFVPFGPLHSVKIMREPKVI